MCVTASSWIMPSNSTVLLTIAHILRVQEVPTAKRVTQSRITSLAICSAALTSFRSHSICRRHASSWEPTKPRSPFRSSRVHPAQAVQSLALFFCPAYDPCPVKSAHRRSTGNMSRPRSTSSSSSSRPTSLSSWVTGLTSSSPTGCSGLPCPWVSWSYAR